MTVIFEVDRLKKEAQTLREILLQYKDKEPDANLCFNILDSTIQKVLDGRITKPIPVDFIDHITGQDTDERRKLLIAIEKEIEDEKNNP